MVETSETYYVTSIEFMESQTPQQEGSAEPTPETGMSGQNSAPQAETRQAKPAELRVIEESLGREFDSIEQAQETLKNLNSLVGDQTVAKQRKALEKLAMQANLTPDELMEVIETQGESTGTTETPAQPATDMKRLVRLETDVFVKENPEAALVRDQLFAEALQTGKPIQELWGTKFSPLIEAGKKAGAKKLQQNLEGQPTRATSTASESDTTVDFSGVNPTTGKRWTSDEMAKYIGYTPPSPRL